MRFSKMQYRRVDFDQLKRDFAELERGLDAAKSGEEQFEIHKKFYEITGHVQTSMELSMIRHDIDTTFMTRTVLFFRIWSFLIRKSCMLHGSGRIWKKKSGRSLSAISSFR